MKYQLTVKSWAESDSSHIHSLIVKTFDTYIKKVGLDLFEQRLDVACLEIGEKIGYVYSRDDNELLFIQRGIN